MLLLAVHHCYERHRAPRVAPPDPAIRRWREIELLDAIWDLTVDDDETRERISLLVWELTWTEVAK
jgi:hypothetical protein